MKNVLTVLLAVTAISLMVFATNSYSGGPPDLLYIDCVDPKDRTSFRLQRDMCDIEATGKGYTVGIFRPNAENPNDPELDCGIEDTQYACLGAPHQDACPCASLDGWNDDTLTQYCGLGGPHSAPHNLGLTTFVFGTNDVFPSGRILLVFDDSQPSGVYSCRSGFASTELTITKNEFHACNASLELIAANDGEDCIVRCRDESLPPCF